MLWYRRSRTYEDFGKALRWLPSFQRIIDAVKMLPSGEGTRPAA